MSNNRKKTDAQRILEAWDPNRDVHERSYGKDSCTLVKNLPADMIPAFAAKADLATRKRKNDDSSPINSTSKTKAKTEHLFEKPVAIESTDHYKKNLQKLTDGDGNVHEPTARNCDVCGKVLNWQTNGKVRKRENGRFDYRPPCKGICTTTFNSRPENKAVIDKNNKKHNPQNNPKNSAKRSDELLAFKTDEQQKIIDGKVEASKPKSDSEIKGLWEKLCSEEPMKSLLHKGAFYIAFARRDRSNAEPTMFLQHRGAKGASNPVLTHEDGTTISKSKLVEKGFQIVELHHERNCLNVAKLEALAHRETWDLGLGRRLHRKCGGVPNIPADQQFLEYGLYLVYNTNGYAPFRLNA